MLSPFIDCVIVVAALIRAFLLSFLPSFLLSSPCVSSIVAQALYFSSKAYPFPTQLAIYRYRYQYPSHMHPTCYFCHELICHCIAFLLHFIALHCFHCISLAFIAFHRISLHITAFHIAFHCISMHFIAFHCISRAQSNWKSPEKSIMHDNPHAPCMQCQLVRFARRISLLLFLLLFLSAMHLPCHAREGEWK